MRKIIIVIGLICLFISSYVWAEPISDEERKIIEELDLYMDYSFWKDASGNEISVEDWAEMLETIVGEGDFSDFLDYYELEEDKR